MSVEVLEERAIEASKTVEVPIEMETITQKERCTTLGGAAIACAGCPFVRFCEIKAEVQQGSIVDSAAEEPTFDELFGFNEISPLFPEDDLTKEVEVVAEPQPEKVITPLPYEVKNTTINYIDRLMDDKIEVVFANSITNYHESSDSNLAPETPVNLVSTEVERPVLSTEPRVIAPKIEAQDTPQALELAYEGIEMVELTTEVAPVDKTNPVTDRPVDPEIIASVEIAQIEEIVKPTKDLTQNILRPKVNVVKKVVVTQPIQKINKTETIVNTIITDSVDSPIFYNGAQEEIIEAKEEPTEIVVEVRTEIEVELGPIDEYVEVIEIPETVVEAEEMVEEVEPIQLKATAQPEGGLKRVNRAEAPEETLPESRLAEALLNGNDDMVDPESRVVGRKITNKLKVLRQLALRALMFGL